MENQRPLGSKQWAANEQLYLQRLRKIYAEYDARIIAHMGSLQGLPASNEWLDDCIARCKAIEPTLDDFDTKAKIYVDHGLTGLSNEVAVYRKQLADTVDILESKKTSLTVTVDLTEGGYKSPPGIPEPQDPRIVMQILTEIRELTSKGMPYPAARAIVEAKYSGYSRNIY
jgi:hypothetical protein